ncbi:hypothetical protein [Streptomyces sp. NPDC088726]|uniref:hypothetical protein n=1 Tax=Streptomyces sp. NPDC088726 TaxID=3365874 RepID=UPI0038124D9A
MSSRPMLTQREAATACGVSRTTIRHRREAGDLLVAAGTCGVLTCQQTVESTLTSHVISPAASARTCNRVNSAGQMPSRCQRRKSP